MAAAATSDVAGELFRAPVRRELDGDKSPADDFVLLKGVGPSSPMPCTQSASTDSSSSPA